MFLFKNSAWNWRSSRLCSININGVLTKTQDIATCLRSFRYYSLIITQLPFRASLKKPKPIIIVHGIHKKEQLKDTAKRLKEDVQNTSDLSKSPHRLMEMKMITLQRAEFKPRCWLVYLIQISLQQLKIVLSSLYGPRVVLCMLDNIGAYSKWQGAWCPGGSPARCGPGHHSRSSWIVQGTNRLQQIDKNIMSQRWI